MYLKRTQYSRQAKLLVILVAWFCAVACGFAYLAVYSNTPGTLREPPKYLNQTLIAHLNGAAIEQGHYLLVMAIHPRCPCTRASLGELNELIAKSDGKLDCAILVYQPVEQQSDWHKTDLWRTAKSLPQSHVIVDDEGWLSDELNLVTSGAVLLCDWNGAVLFYGGVTSARGHQGDNLGSDAILSIARSGQTVRKNTPVYGCAIRPDRISTAPRTLCGEQDDT